MTFPSRVVHVGDVLTYAEAGELPIGSVVHYRGIAYELSPPTAARSFALWVSAESEVYGSGGLWVVLPDGQACGDRVFHVSRIGPAGPITLPGEARASAPTEQLARLVLDALGRDLHFIDGQYVTTARNPK